MKLTDIDMRAYSIYSEIEGYSKITNKYNPIMSLDDFIYDKNIHNNNYVYKFYNLAKKELRKEKLEKLNDYRN